MKKIRFDEMNERQQHTVIIIAGIVVLIILAVMLGIIEVPSSVIMLVFLITATAIVIGGIVRIVNIIRTPTEKEHASPAPVVEVHHVEDGQNSGQQTVVVVQQAHPAEKQTKGRVWGTLGMIYMAGYAMYIQYVMDSASVTNLGEAIGKAAAYKIVQPFFYCVLASAILSLVGVVGKNKTCVLLALVATIGSIFILPRAFENLLIPAVMFLISYIRMAK